MDLTRYWDAMAYLESYIRGSSEARLSRAELEAHWRQKLPSMEHLLDRLGNPHRRFPSLHVGGTSGKGSTATIAASILQAAGYTTGLHTSPYLQAAIEKIMIDGRPVPPLELAALVEESRPIFEELRQQQPFGPLNFVQLWTALAFSYLARRRVDIGVIEVSLGGRFDYTNVLSPLAAAITTVDFDHVNTLGDTIPQIAWHKAGIVKPGTPVATGVRRPEALAVIEDECGKLGATLYRLGLEFTYELRGATGEGSHFDYRGPGGQRRDLHVTMLGEHQVRNACLAVCCIDLLRHRGFPVDDEALRAGLTRAHIPGRMEVVQERPAVLLDGAHNREKAETLRWSIETLFPGRPVVLVVGIGAGKEAGDILATLAPLARLVFCTAAGVVGKPASLPEELTAGVRSLGVEARAEPDPFRALDSALAAADAGTVVCVTGSLFLVGALRERWRPVAAILEEAQRASGTARPSAAETR